MGGGVQAMSANLLAPPDGRVRDIASLQQTLREWMAADEGTIRKVNLIVGFGHDDSRVVRYPTAYPRRPRTTTRS